MQINTGIGISGNGRTNDINKAQHGRPPLFGLLYRCESVSGFTRLAYRYNDGAVFDDWISISKFAGVFGFRGDTRQLLEQKLTDQAGVESGSAGGQDKMFGACQLTQI